MLSNLQQSLLYNLSLSLQILRCNAEHCSVLYPCQCWVKLATIIALSNSAMHYGPRSRAVRREDKQILQGSQTGIDTKDKQHTDTQRHIQKTLTIRIPASFTMLAALHPAPPTPFIKWSHWHSLVLQALRWRTSILPIRCKAFRHSAVVPHFSNLFKLCYMPNICWWPYIWKGVLKQRLLTLCLSWCLFEFKAIFLSNRLYWNLQQSRCLLCVEDIELVEFAW